MRYELSDYEWTAIKPMLPNKPRGVRRVNDRRCAARPEAGVRSTQAASRVGAHVVTI
jgi:transposase